MMKVKKMPKIRRWREEEKGVKKDNGYVIKSGHKAKWIYKAIVTKIQGRYLVQWNCDVSGKLCCEWMSEEQIIKEYEFV